MPRDNARRAHERRFLPQGKERNLKGQHARRTDSIELLEEGLTKLGGKQRLMELPNPEKDDVEPFCRLVFLQNTLAKGDPISFELGRPAQAFPQATDGIDNDAGRPQRVGKGPSLASEQPTQGPQDTAEQGGH